MAKRTLIEVGHSYIDAKDVNHIKYIKKINMYVITFKTPSSDLWVTNEEIQELLKQFNIARQTKSKTKLVEPLETESPF
jgi:hypothetical protein